MFQQTVRKSSSESGEKLLSVDDVISLVSLISRDVIGCKTRVKFIHSNWSVLIPLLLVKLSNSVFSLFISFVYVASKEKCQIWHTKLMSRRQK